MFVFLRCWPGLAAIREQQSVLKPLSIRTSSVRAMVGSPGIRRDNKTDISHTPPTGNKDKKHLRPMELPEKTCLLGNCLGRVAELEAEVEEVTPDAAPALLRNSGNYCLTSPVPVARPVKDVINVKRQNFSVSVQQPVLCPVVSPVPFVLNGRGQS